MAQRTVMLESDIGEGFGVWSFGDDDGLLEIVDAANIACGFHGGDPAIMMRTCRIAVERGVRIGAHVSYRDLAGFGRRDIAVPTDELIADVVYQIGALRAVAASVGGEVTYLKAHGALYNTAAIDERTADAVATAVSRAGGDLPIVCPPGSVQAAAAGARGLAVIAEGFADRGYDPDGRLMARSLAGSVIHDPAEAARRAGRMATEGIVTARDGTDVDLGAPVAALCVHSDTAGAREIAAAVRDALDAAGLSRPRA